MVCGRRLSWRANWGPEWLVDRYCSTSCSERRLAPLDYQLEETILLLLGGDSPGESLSVSAVAKSVDPLGWESLLERALNAARRLAARGSSSLVGRDSKDSHLWGVDDLRIRLPD